MSDQVGKPAIDLCLGLGVLLALAACSSSPTSAQGPVAARPSVSAAASEEGVDTTPPTEGGALASFPSAPVEGLPAGAVLRFGSDRLRLDHMPRKIAVAGHRAATTHRKVVTLWDLQSGAPIETLTLPERPMRIALTDEALLVIERRRRKRSLRRVSLDTGETEARIDIDFKGYGTHDDFVASADGKRVAAILETTIVVWDATGPMRERFRRRLKWGPPERPWAAITDLDVTDRGVIVTAGGRVGLIDDDGKDVVTVSGGYSAAATPDGIVFTRSKKNLGLLSWPSSAPVALPIPSTGSVTMGGDGHLWMRDDDELVRIDLKKRRIVGRFDAVGLYDLRGPTHDGVLLRTGGRLVAVGPDGFTPEHGDELSSSDLSPDGRRLATRDDSGRLLVWNARTGEAITAIEPKHEMDNSVSLLKAPFLLAIDKANMRPGVARLVNIRSGRSTVISEDLFWHTADVASDGLHFVMGSQVSLGRAFVSGRHSYRLDPSSGEVKRLGKLEYPGLQHNCAVVGPRLIGFGYDPETGRTEVFAVEVGRTETLFYLEGQQNLNCAPDGRHFVRLGRSEHAPDEVLDADGKLVATLAVSPERYPRVAFTADGQHFAIMTEPRHFDVWSLEGGMFRRRGVVEVAADPHHPERWGSYHLAPGGTHLYHRRTHEVLVYEVAEGR